MATRVIQFNEQTGEQLTKQVEFTVEGSEKGPAEDKPPVELPWRAWHNATGPGSGQGCADADRAAAVVALESLYARTRHERSPVTIVRQDGTYRVKTDKKVKKGDILLTPCVPANQRVVPTTTHPHAGKVTMQVKTVPGGPALAGSSTEGGDTVRKATFWVLPEFKPPKLKPQSRDAVAGDSQAEAAVAGQTAVSTAVAATENAIAEVSRSIPVNASDWQWDPQGGHSMMPFWAVRRMTPSQMAKEATSLAHKNDNRANNGWKLSSERAPRATCALENHVVSTCTVGTVQGESVGVTRIYGMDFMTNSMDLDVGEELILQVPEPAPVVPQVKKRTWREAQQAQDAKEKQKALKTEADMKKQQELVKKQHQASL